MVVQLKLLLFVDVASFALAMTSQCDEDESGMLQITKRKVDWEVISEDFGCETNLNNIKRYRYVETHGTETECKEICENDPRCLAIDFFRDGPGGWCNLFDAICTTPHANWQRPRSWRIPSRVNNIQLSGYRLEDGHCVTPGMADVVETAFETQDLNECADACGTDCVGFEWYPSESGNWDGGNCFHVLLPTLTGIAGSPKYPRWKDAQCYAKLAWQCGPGVATPEMEFAYSSTASNEDECGTICKETKNCGGFTFDDAMCRLFSDHDPAAVAGAVNYCRMGWVAPAITGIHRNWFCESGVHINSGQIGRNDNADTKQECSGQCALTQGCACWDFTPGAGVRTCRLFGAFNPNDWSTAGGGTQFCLVT